MPRESRWTFGVYAPVVIIFPTRGGECGGRKRGQSQGDRRESSRGRLHRRLDQLDGVVAAPFRWAGNGADLAALAVHQHRCRHPQRSAYLLKILEHLGFLVTEIV